MHYVLHCPQYTLHRTALFIGIQTIIPDFDQFSDQRKLDTLLQGKNVHKSQQVAIAGLFKHTSLVHVVLPLTLTESSQHNTHNAKPQHTLHTPARPWLLGAGLSITFEVARRVVGGVGASGSGSYVCGYFVNFPCVSLSITFCF